MIDPLGVEAALTLRAWLWTSLGLAILGLVVLLASSGTGLYLSICLAALAVAFGVAARWRFDRRGEPLGGTLPGRTLPLLLAATVAGASALLVAYVIANP
jgi:hypothetical protein